MAGLSVARTPIFRRSTVRLPTRRLWTMGTTQHERADTPKVRSLRHRLERASRAARIDAAEDDYSHRWICGDCLYREEHPDAATLERARKPKVPQEETLL